MVAGPLLQAVGEILRCIILHSLIPNLCSKFLIIGAKTIATSLYSPVAPHRGLKAEYARRQSFLIVKDAVSICMKRSQIIAGSGYTARSASVVPRVVESAQTHGIWADTLKTGWDQQMKVQRL
jgi:hypothetical protein